MTGKVEATVNEDAVRVCSRGEDGPFITEIDARGHSLVADEPQAAGGGDAGPSPYAYLLASLGACTAMTLRMYADRKGFNLERVCVRLTHGRDHAHDCAECEVHDQRVERIERHVELEGNLDESQRRRLLRIAERCPVHQTLSAGLEIETAEGRA